MKKIKNKEKTDLQGIRIAFRDASFPFKESFDKDKNEITICFYVEGFQQSVDSIFDKKGKLKGMMVSGNPDSLLACSETKA